MDPTELRLEKIRQALALAESITHLQARLFVALVVVALAGAVSAVAASIAGQVPWSASRVVSVPLSGLVGWALLRMAGLAANLKRGYLVALRDIDNLIFQEGEDDDDGKASDERGA